MAEKKIYLGSVGPYLFEDTEAIEDADGDFAGELRHAITTDKQIIITEAPTQDNELTRLGDLIDYSSQGIISYKIATGKKIKVLSYQYIEVETDEYIIEGTGYMELAGNSFLMLSNFTDLFLHQLSVIDGGSF